MTYNASQQNKRNTSVLFGVLIATAGILFLLRQFDILNFDFQIWPLFFIAFGVLNGMKKNDFLTISSLGFILFGLAFFIPHFTVFGVASSRLFWPIVLIVGGFYIAFGAKKKRHNYADTHQKMDTPLGAEEVEYIQTESFLNIEAYFGGRKEIITSKQFSGCDATAMFGGVEINLMQADSSKQPMVIDMRVICGGIQIIVPSHWEIINEVDVLLGGIEDKRNLRTASESAAPKQLLLRGSVTMGGLELKSY